MTLKTLGDHIHFKRLEKGFYAKGLAQQLGVPTSMIGRWERDEVIPNESQWQLLARLLDIHADLLHVAANTRE